MFLQSGCVFLGRLRSDLIKHLLCKLNESLKDTEVTKDIDSDKVLRIINVLERLLPFVLILCVSNENVLERVDIDMAIDLRKSNLLFLIGKRAVITSYCRNGAREIVY